MCIIQSVSYSFFFYKSNGLHIDALAVCLCGVGVLLIAFIGNFEWILPQQLCRIVLRN